MNTRAGLVHRGRAVMVYTPATRRNFVNHWQKICKSVTRHAHIAAEVETCAPASVRRALQQYQPDLLIAAGGDGTVNLCIQAMKDDDLLAVLPLGTANDLLRSLGKPSGFTHGIDRIQINDQVFCTTGGLGVPCAVAQQVNRVRQSRFERASRKMGRHIYALVAANLVLRKSIQTQWAEIEWEDVDSGTTRRIRLRTNTIFVTNQATFGGSLCVVSESVNDDGHFEICIFKNQSYWRDLIITGRIALAADQCERDCSVLRALSARITTTEPMPFFGDGEIVANSRHFDLEISPGVLNILNLDWGLENMVSN